MTLQRALSSGLSGVRANQQYLDIIGTNLANVNTQGYKSSRVTFTNLFAQNLRSGTGPTNGRGGINPAQVGTGVQIGSVDLNFIQGSLVATGNEFDLGIRGDGFFVLRQGGREFFTRVGAFGLDESNNLVDQRTGFRVQSTDNEDIQLVRNSVLLGEATQSINLAGSLPSTRSGPLAELQETDRPFERATNAVMSGGAGPFNLTGTTELRIRVGTTATQTIDLSGLPNLAAATAAEVATEINDQAEGVIASVTGGVLTLTSEAAGTNATINLSFTTAAQTLFGALAGTTTRGTTEVATAATSLNELSSNTDDYVNGDEILIEGMFPDGEPRSGVFTFGVTGTTLGDLVTHLNTVFARTPAEDGVTFTLQADGTISYEANTPGPAPLMNMRLTDGSATAQQGATNWNTHFFRTVTEGAGPDTGTTTATVYDTMGTRRQVTLTFEREDDVSWRISASVPESVGTVTSAPITGIGFDQNGRLTKVPDLDLQIEWNGIPGAQDLTLDLGTAGSADGLVMSGQSRAVSVRATSDGFEAGTLSSFQIGSDGVIEGIYTNDQRRELATIALALFTNNQGLDDLGDGLYTVGTNSGEAQMTLAEIGSAGSIESNTLEGSNVDIAAEFVRLIEAQRAFQASARVVSTSDEVLTELVNLVN